MKKHIVIQSIATFAPAAEKSYTVANTKITTFFAEKAEDVLDEWEHICKEMEPFGYYCNSETKTIYLFPDGTKEEFAEDSDVNKLFLEILNKRFRPR
ncbi:MAG: hypothetical protein WD552_00640 [Candidatus Paceibacterota bacterium]